MEKNTNVTPEKPTTQPSTAPKPTRQVYKYSYVNSNWWVYEIVLKNDGKFKIRMFNKNIKEKDIIITPLPNNIDGMPYFEIIKIKERRDHRGVFNDKDLQTMSYVVAEAKQLTKEEAKLI